MANKAIVKDLKDVGKLVGVDKVVHDADERRTDMSGVEALVDKAMPQGVSGEGDLNALLNFKPSEFIKEGKKTAAILLEELAKVKEVVEKVSSAKETLEKIRQANRKKGVLGDTEETLKLRSMIEAGEYAFEKTDKEVKQLYRFRRDDLALRDLVDKGHAVFKALKKGEKADGLVLDELKTGYADFLHTLLREGRIVEVEEEQLRKWANQRQSFSDHASSWLYKDCKICERRCRTHWFWGIHGDDQSIQLARDLRDLNNINSRIRNLLNPKPRLEVKKHAAVQVATVASTPISADEPTEGSTPVEPESGPTES